MPRDTHLREAEIGQLNVPLPINEHILWLQAVTQCGAIFRETRSDMYEQLRVECSTTYSL